MESWRDSQAVKLLTSLSLMAVAMGCILLQKKRATAELRKARRKKKELGNVNIGGEILQVAVALALYFFDTCFPKTRYHSHFRNGCWWNVDKDRVL